MESTEEILEIVRDIREDISYMKRHRNMLCGMPILEVAEVCDLLKMSDRQLRRYRTSGQLTGFRFGRRLLFSSAEITQFIELFIYKFSYNVLCIRKSFLASDWIDCS